MKKLLPTLLTIILTVVIFTGCKSLFPSQYDQFDLGDTVEIAIGQTIYENKHFWVRLDSIIEDSRCPEGAYCLWEGRVAFRMSVSFGIFGDEMHMDFSSDTCMDHSVIVKDDPVSAPGNLCDIIIVEISPYPVIGDTISKEDYIVKFVIEDNTLIDKKPNLYLYPEKKTKMTVTMDFPHGGKVIHSDPLYPVDWKNIKVKPDGKIDKKFDFLFYECEIPDFWQYVEGWVVKQEELPEFFENNLKAYGFNDAEIEDFIDWWVPDLTDDPYYIILPQYTEMVNQVIKLWITPRPDSMMRLHYVISGSIFNFELPEPEIPEFNAEGFVAREWGVILK